jgi:hypothetical protein
MNVSILEYVMTRNAQVTAIISPKNERSSLMPLIRVVEVLRQSTQRSFTYDSAKTQVFVSLFERSKCSQLRI